MNAKGTFKTGDLVKLKSGGPKMTVEEEVSPMNIRCQWFAGKKLESGLFRPDSLVHIKEAKEDEEKD